MIKSAIIQNLLPQPLVRRSKCKKNFWSVYLSTASLHWHEQGKLWSKWLQLALVSWLLYMWPDLQKGVFHKHPIYQLWQSITSDWKQPFPWNLNNSEYQHRLIDVENFSFVCALKPKLQYTKFIELDVCGRPIFANSVTCYAVIELYVEQSYRK